MLNRPLANCLEPLGKRDRVASNRLYALRPPLLEILTTSCDGLDELHRRCLHAQDARVKVAASFGGHGALLKRAQPTHSTDGLQQINLRFDHPQLRSWAALVVALRWEQADMTQA